MNWNGKQAPGWRAADDNFTFGSVQRSERLEDRVRAGLARGGKLDPTELTKAMADAATVDLRGEEIYPLLRRVIGSSGDPALAEPLRLLDGLGARRQPPERRGRGQRLRAQRRGGAHGRLVGPAHARGNFEPALGTPLVDRIAALNEFSQQPDGQGSSFFCGWYSYVDKDLRRLLGDRVTGPLSRRYCGGGSLAACRSVLTSTLAAATATDAAGEQGGSLAFTGYSVLAVLLLGSLLLGAGLLLRRTRRGGA